MEKTKQDELDRRAGFELRCRQKCVFCHLAMHERRTGVGLVQRLIGGAWVHAVEDWQQDDGYIICEAFQMRREEERRS